MKEGRLSWQILNRMGMGKTREGEDQNMLVIERKRPNFGSVLRNRAANQRPCRCVGKGPATDLLPHMLWQASYRDKRYVFIADKAVRGDGKANICDREQAAGKRVRELCLSHAGWVVWSRTTRSAKVSLQVIRNNRIFIGTRSGWDDVGR